MGSVYAACKRAKATSTFALLYYIYLFVSFYIAIENADDALIPSSIKIHYTFERLDIRKASFVIGLAVLRFYSIKSNAFFYY